MAIAGARPGRTDYSKGERGHRDDVPNRRLRERETAPGGKKEGMSIGFDRQEGKKVLSFWKTSPGREKREKRGD